MYIIRADGNASIGAGHLMRCLTIAEELKRNAQTDIVFWCADEQSAGIARDSGFLTRVLHTDYTCPESELGLWKEYFEQNGPKDRKEVLILIDSYYATDTYLRSLAGFGGVYVMDDMGQKAFPAEGVVNYNAFADE